MADAPANAINVDAGDVIRLIMQFCKENSLQRTLATLQEETALSLNTVDNMEAFLADVTNGRWDAVLHNLKTLSLPPNLLFDIYEQMYLELLELREIDTARMLLAQSKPMAALRQADGDRFLRLQRLLSRPHFEPREAYPDGSSKEKRRAAIAKALEPEVAVVPPARLMALISQGIKWQQYQGLLPPGTDIDLFRGTTAAPVEEEDECPQRLKKTIKFGKQSHPECACFSLDGQSLVTGSVDGFIEVWDWTTGKLRRDLKYQAEDKMMMHNEAVFCLVFSKDNQLLASGSKDGKVKVWELKSGRCLRRFDGAHSGGVTCVCFASDSTKVLSSSYDHTIRLHGLKSGKTLKTYRGHASFVNTAVFSEDESKVISGSSDGTIKVWDTKTMDCLNTFSPKENLSIHTICLISPSTSSNLGSLLLVGNKSSECFVMDMQGRLLKTFTAEGVGATEAASSAVHNETRRDLPNVGKSDLVSCVLSRKGKYVFAGSEGGNVFCFEYATGRMETVLQDAHSQSLLGLAAHPRHNILASWATDGLLKLWKK
ncbi:Serine/threonine-protein kinase smu1 [Balamuthia mandrillaris]